MTRPSDISRTFAELIVDTTWERLPERVRHEAKRSILNFMATALAGWNAGARRMMLVGFVLASVSLLLAWTAWTGLRERHAASDFDAILKKA